MKLKTKLLIHSALIISLVLPLLFITAQAVPIGAPCTLTVRSTLLGTSVVVGGRTVPDTAPPGAACDPLQAVALGIPLPLGVTCGTTIPVLGLITVRANCPR